MNAFSSWTQKPIFNLGFRVFFLSAAVHALLSMGLWLSFYAFNWPPLPGVIPQYWHGREMIMGFSYAVVAGFLLTAVQNWTGVAMPRGSALMRLWLLWLAARLLALLPPPLGYISLFLDMAFAAALLWTVQSACRRAEGQIKRQAGILAKLGLMLLLEALLSYAILAKEYAWMAPILYAAALIIIGLVLTIGRRVLPFFTQNGLKALGIEFTPQNDARLDAWCLRFFLLFFALSFFQYRGWAQYPLAVAALLTAATNGKRLLGWHHPAIWRLPLLWSLHLAFLLMLLGLLLFALRPLWPLWPAITPSIALHALTLAGMGLMVLSMMGRVALGHTGRSIHEPPKALLGALLLLLFAWLFRVLLPLLAPQSYAVWMIHAQSAWMLAFALFVWAYQPILTRPRVDGRPG